MYYISRRERLANLVHRPDLRGVLRSLGAASDGSFGTISRRRSKVLYAVILHSKYTGALTLQNFVVV